MLWVLSDYRGFSDWVSPLATHSLKVWDRLNESLALVLWMSPLAPVGGYPCFPPGEQLSFFGTWARDGIVSSNVNSLMSSCITYTAWHILALWTPKHKRINYRLLSSGYRVPRSLARMYPSASDQCWRGHSYTYGRSARYWHLFGQWLVSTYRIVLV